MQKRARSARTSTAKSAPQLQATNRFPRPTARLPDPNAPAASAASSGAAHARGLRPRAAEFGLGEEKSGDGLCGSYAERPPAPASAAAHRERRRPPRAPAVDRARPARPAALREMVFSSSTRDALSGSQKKEAKSLTKAVDAACKPPPDAAAMESCAALFATTAEGPVCGEGVRHLRKILQSGDAGGSAIIACGVAGQILLASPAARRAVGSGPAGKKFCGAMLTRATAKEPSPLRDGARLLLRRWRDAYFRRADTPAYASRRRHSRDVDIPRTSRGGAAAATWKFGRDPARAAGTPTTRSRCRISRLRASELRAGIVAFEMRGLWR